MKKFLFFTLLLTLLCSCSNTESTPSDLQPIISGQFQDAKAVYYPSTDFKVSAVVVDKDGNVYYLRMNAVDQMRDNIKLFNVNDFK